MSTRLLIILSAIGLLFGCAETGQDEVTCTQVIQKINECFPGVATEEAEGQDPLCSQEDIDLYVANDLGNKDCQAVAAAGKADGCNLSCILAPVLAKSLFKPNRQPLVKNPADYDMKYTNVSFTAEDGVKIKGWLVESKTPTDRLIIMTHPLPFTRYGFSIKHQGFFRVTEIEVELLKTVKALSDAGYMVLTFDFRNHGESGEGNNGFSAIGQEEWKDVVAAVKYVKSWPDLASMKLAFVSHCQGANATIIAMSKAPEVFSDIKALVAIQPVSMDVFLPRLLEDKYPLFKNCVDAIDVQAKKYTGYNLADMSPWAYVQDIPSPVLYMQVYSDPWTEPFDVESFYQKSPEPKELLWVYGEELERFDGYNYFGKKPQEMLNFLDKYMAEPLDQN